MAREIDRLSARSVVTLTEPGLHADGRGLYLRIERDGAKRWAFLFHWKGRRREMGLGSIHSVPLATARQEAAQARQAVAAGKDPIEERRRRRVTEGQHTFGAAAEEFLSSKASEWKNPKHRQQWRTTLTKDAAALSSMPVSVITTEDVLSVLKPIWLEKPETASRLRGRIERVLDAAKVKGHRAGENPARWKGHLSHLLSKPKKLTRGHHRAMPFLQLPAFIADLRGRDGVGARALEFTILTAARTNETVAARECEFDLAAGVWTVPASRMKRKREHRVPLSLRALSIVRDLWTGNPDNFLFRSSRANKPLSSAAMSELLDHLRPDLCTVHGFRSSFKDWCTEATDFPDWLSEAALSHLVGDETERAYKRSDALEKRRAVMNAWAEYCEPGHALRLISVRG